MYRLLRPFLFMMDGERAHHVTFALLKFLNKIHCLPTKTLKSNPVDCFGLQFPNPVGLAAGLDKNGEYIDLLAKVGFGFIEIGTVTPKPQAGNPKPRLFRVKQDQAVLNRMGFNNKGVDYLIEQVKKRKSKVILGINIGKNATTPIESAVDDYITCFDKVYPYADYITANISSPNTENLRALQFDEQLRALLKALKERQKLCTEKHGKYKPLLIKVAPDLMSEEVTMLAKDFLEFEIDGVIATNTTVARDLLTDRSFDHEKGGVSGKPLLQQANIVLAEFHKHLQGKVPLVGVGGIHDAASAKSKFDNGAKLIQIYSALVYHGAGWLKKIG